MNYGEVSEKLVNRVVPPYDGKFIPVGKITSEDLLDEYRNIWNAENNLDGRTELKVELKKLIDDYNRNHLKILKLTVYCNSSELAILCHQNNYIYERILYLKKMR